MSRDSQFRIFPLISLCHPQHYRKYLHKQAIYTLRCLCWPSCDFGGFRSTWGERCVPKARQSSPGGAGLGCSPQVYLNGGHLCVSSPAEALKLQRVVAEAHGPAGRRGAFLQLEFQVVKVREIMVPCRSGEKREHCYLLSYPEGAARGHLCQARGRCDSSPDDEVPHPRGGRGHRGRQSTPRCSLLGAGGTPCALPAATGSAPLLAGRPQRPADVAPAACGRKRLFTFPPC